LRKQYRRDGLERLKISVDTNILVRSAVIDNSDQARAAAQALRDSEVVAISLSCLCEFFWVLSRVYRLEKRDISTALYKLIDAANVVVDRPAVEAGLKIFNAGGDFADGVIAYEGRWMGGETFVSFDKKAVALISKQGQPAVLLS
jgi:predicted nucleic-acid-binding protein